MTNGIDLSHLENRVTNADVSRACTREPAHHEKQEPKPAPAPVIVWTLPLGARTCPLCGSPMERRGTYYPPREPGQPIEAFVYVTLSCCSNPVCDHREAN